MHGGKEVIQESNLKKMRLILLNTLFPLLSWGFDPHSLETVCVLIELHWRQLICLGGGGGPVAILYDN